MAGAAASDAVDDDAGLDDDHAHEPRQVGRQFRRRVLVEVTDVSAGLEMGDDVGEAGESETRKAQSDEERKAAELASHTFYREHTLVIHRRV